MWHAGTISWVASSPMLLMVVPILVGASIVASRNPASRLPLSLAGLVIAAWLLVPLPSGFGFDAHSYWGRARARIVGRTAGCGGRLSCPVFGHNPGAGLLVWSEAAMELERARYAGTTAGRAGQEAAGLVGAIGGIVWVALLFVIAFAIAWQGGLAIGHLILAVR